MHLFSCKLKNWVTSAAEIFFFFAFLAKNNLARHINEYSTGGFEAWLEISEVKE